MVKFSGVNLQSSNSICKDFWGPNLKKMESVRPIYAKMKENPVEL